MRLLLVSGPAVDRLLGLVEVADRFTYVPTTARALPAARSEADTMVASRTGSPSGG